MIADKPPSVAQQKLAGFERELRRRLRDSRTIEGYTPTEVEMYGHLLTLASIVRDLAGETE